MVQCGSFTVSAVIDEGDVNVFECSLSELNGADNPREIDNPNRTFQAEATIRNGNNTSVDTNVEFRLNGQLIERVSVTIGADSNEDVRTQFNPADDFGISTGQTFRVTAEQSGSVTSAMRAQDRTPTVRAPVATAGGACGVCGDGRGTVADRVRSSARSAAGAVTATTSSTSTSATAAAPITGRQNIQPQNCLITAVEVPPGSPMTVEFEVSPQSTAVTGDAIMFIFDSNDNRVKTETLGTASAPPDDFRSEPNLYQFDTTVPNQEGDFRVVVQVQNEEYQ